MPENARRAGSPSRQTLSSNRFQSNRDLFGEIVSFAGDEVAAVVADSEDLAKQPSKKSGRV